MQSGSLFYMEVDEREKYDGIWACVWYISEWDKKCLTKIVAVYVKKMYNMSQRS